MVPEPTQPLTDKRQDSLHRLDHLTEPEVLILGGGVNGVGTFRDLALNGVSAVLIDTGDFCTGASSASSRMAHGGLRYLEGREFRLVAEAAQERNRLIRHARHLVRPLPFLVPVPGIAAGFGRSVGRFLGLCGDGGPLSLAALQGALGLYEFLGRGADALPRHTVTLRRDRFPDHLNRKVKAVVQFFDGQITNPEGLVFELLAEALAQGGHVAALNHADWTCDNGLFTIRDRFSGSERTIRPQVVVNATGSAIDHVNAALGGVTQYVRGVKGAHLVLDHPGLTSRISDRAFYFDDGSGRMVLALPLAENVLVGTTEVDVTDPQDRSVSDREIDYLLTAINSLFEDLTVTRNHVVSLTSGIRPLRRDDSGSATSASRDHVLETDRFDDTGQTVLSLVGGKWTTFRAFSEQAADRVLATLGRARQTSTAARDYPGAQPCNASSLAETHGLSANRAADLITRYGAIAGDVAAFCVALSENRPLHGIANCTTGEIEWLIRNRSAQTLEDILLRRTRLTQGRGISEDTVRDVAAVLQATLNRPEPDLDREIAAALRNPRIVGCRNIGQKAA